MIKSDTAFALAVTNGADFYNYIEMTLRDGTNLTIDKTRIMVGGCNIIDNCTTGKFAIGTAIGKIAKIRLANYDDYFSRYDFYKAYMTIFVCVDVEGVTYKVRRGVFCVTTPVSTGEIITMQAVDDMYKFDKTYDSNLAYPATLSEILSDCCTKCGVTNGLGQFNRYDYVINHKPEDSTYRDVVTFCAQVAASNAKISEAGALRLSMYKAFEDGNSMDGGDFRYDNVENIVDGGDFSFSNDDTVVDGGSFSDETPVEIQAIKSLSVGTDQLHITGVKIKVDYKEEYLSGTEDYCLSITSNKFIQTEEEAKEIADAILADVSGISFRIFNATILQNPLIQSGDVVHIYDRKGNQYLSVVNSVNYTVGGYTAIACKADSPTYEASAYNSPAAQAVAAERRRAEKELSVYDQAVQNMNRLAMNSLGFHTTYVTESNGSRVTYLHDKDTLANSTIIYKQTIDGFFLSQDGGASYTAGFDSSGNAVLNVLSAIGIEFDWARGGTLSLGGENNKAGRAIIYNSDNKVDITIGEDGINFYYDYAEDEGVIKRGFSIAKGSITGNGFITCNKVTADRVYGTKEVYAGRIYANTKACDTYLEYGKLQVGDISVSNSNGIYTAGNKIDAGNGNIYCYELHTLSTIETNGGKIDAGTGEIKGGKLNVETGEVIGKTGKFTSLEVNQDIKAASITATSMALVLKSNTSCNGTFSVTGKTTLKDVSITGAMDLKDVSCTGISVSSSGYSKSFIASSSGVEASNLEITGSFTCKGTTMICDGAYDTLKFFGANGSTRKSVTAMSTYGTVDAAACRTKINEILTALKSYGLIA